VATFEDEKLSTNTNGVDDFFLRKKRRVEQNGQKRLHIFSAKTFYESTKFKSLTLFNIYRNANAIKNGRVKKRKKKKTTEGGYFTLNDQGGFFVAATTPAAAVGCEGEKREQKSGGRRYFEAMNERS
jgi:hypothetical protein